MPIMDEIKMRLLRSSAAATSRVATWLRPALREQRGQGMVEYALILVLIAIVVIVIVTVVGQQVNNVFSNVSNGLAQ
jgi:pilus assembly protein Flp/PilA